MTFFIIHTSEALVQRLPSWTLHSLTQLPPLRFLKLVHLLIMVPGIPLYNLHAEGSLLDTETLALCSCYTEVIWQPLQSFPYLLCVVFYMLPNVYDRFYQSSIIFLCTMTSCLPLLVQVLQNFICRPID